MRRKTGEANRIPIERAMQIRYWPKLLPFRHPFTISHGTKTHQPSLIVALTAQGQTGYGEAPAIVYYHIPVEKMIQDLESKQAWLESFAFTEPERFWHYVHHLFPDNPFLVCALDIAAWDLFGKMMQKPLYAIWKLNPRQGPITDYTLGIDRIPIMLQKMREMPWPLYKIKLGTPDDLDMVRALRGQTTSRFRVDANGGWNLEQALETIPTLAQWNVELIEQPLAKGNDQEMEILFARSALPLVADESCVSESDVRSCVGRFHGINIKLTKCAGITPARRMIREARGLGLQVMLGSMNETSIGSAALAHLSPLADFLDMDGPLLLGEDLATGLVIDQGTVKIPEGPGLGVAVHGLDN